MKTAELTGAALDWAVAKSEGLSTYVEVVEGFKPTTDWVLGGPIIERELLLLQPHGLSWECSMGGDKWFKGPTPLISAMRCYVASKLGDTVEIPSELL
jgi:hypothetical protein